MNIEKENLDKARELLKELEALEGVKDVCSNYDASAHVTFWTLHNSNRKEVKQVQIPLPLYMYKSMHEYVENRIYEVKKELESL